VAKKRPVAERRLIAGVDLVKRLGYKVVEAAKLLGVESRELRRLVKELESVEERQLLLTSPRFQEAVARGYRELPADIPRGEAWGEPWRGLPEFVRFLCDTFEADLAGLVWLENYGFSRICCSYAPNARLKAALGYGSLVEWLRLTSDNRLPEHPVCLELQKLARLSACVFEINPASECEDLPAELKGQRLIALRIPRIYDSNPDSSCGFACLLYEDPTSIYGPSTKHNDLDRLSSLVDTWAWTVSHNRSQMQRACHRIQSNWPEIENSALVADWTIVVRAISILRRFLTIEEIIRIRSHWLRLTGRDFSKCPEPIVPMPSLSGEWGREGEENEGKLRGEDLISRFLGTELQEWQYQCPPYWPPRAADSTELEEQLEDIDRERRLVRNLLYWCYWRDPNPPYTGSLRRTEDYQSARDDGRSWRALRAAGRQMNGLADHAFEKINADRDAKGKGECLLGDKSLSLFFLSEAARLDETQKRYWMSGAPSDEDMAHALSDVSAVAHYLLAEFSLDERTIRGLARLLFEHVHRRLGVPQRLDIAHHLAQAARTEPSLHVLKRFYRDHFFHAIEVCFLGHFLLEMRTGAGIPLWETVAAKLGCSGDKQRVLRLWYIASLIHDVGYGIEVMKGVKRLLTFFKNARPLKRLTADVQKALGRLSKALADEPFLDFSTEDRPGEDHGVVAARHLHGLIETIESDDPEVKLADYQAAVDAIARHNHRGKNAVVFEKAPLSFLLILCDTLQEWSRPRLHYDSAPYEILSWMRQSSTEKNIGGPLRHISLNIEAMSDDRRFEMTDPNVLRMVLEFDEDINRNDQVFFLWLDASSNLQRLDFSGLDFDIDVEFVTPFLRKGLGLGPEQQFHRLGDAARETHMGFLERWFPTGKADKGPGSSNGAVTYWADRHPGTEDPHEHLVLHLRELAKSRPITKDFDEFSEYLSRWKHYHDNREFLGDYGLPEFPG